MKKCPYDSAAENKKKKKVERSKKENPNSLRIHAVFSGFAMAPLTDF
jgi:hypothetical protein